MPTLIQLLQSEDLGHLRIVARLWGLEPEPTDMDREAEAMATAMQDRALVREVIDALDVAAQSALRDVALEGGRMPWAAFARKHGEVRQMGAARRDREQPYQHPASAAEVLFYRGLIGRAFLDIGKGPLEMVYIPDDLQPLVSTGPRAPEVAPARIGRAATPAERAVVARSGDQLLDDATTLLAALRTDHETGEDSVLMGLLEAAGILVGGVPQPARVKAFLELSRPDAMALLATAWQDSTAFNELRLLPGVLCEGSWTNRPREARHFILEQVRALPDSTWWHLPSFVHGIKETYADYQRPAGDFDSWLIRRIADGAYVRGLGSWDEIDGALIRFIVAVVMPRLGLLEIGRHSVDGVVTAFKKIKLASSRNAQAETGRLHIGSQGRIVASRSVPRAVRYQLARFCDWDAQGPDEYRFHISPGSLRRATKQGLKVEQLLSLLAKHGDAGIPSSVTKALKRWETTGTEARTEGQVVLRVTRPEMIKELGKSKAARYLGEALGPTTVIVKPGAAQKVSEAMLELGWLMEDATRVEGAEAPPAAAPKSRQETKDRSSAKVTGRK